MLTAKNFNVKQAEDMLMAVSNFIDFIQNVSTIEFILMFKYLMNGNFLGRAMEKGREDGYNSR